MSYTAKLDHFEGPLDLLLQLIEQSELDITEITLSSVTSQYLAYVNDLRIVAAGDLQQFLDLAAKLIYLKSIALLPTLANPEQDDELSDLATQLQQYRNYTKAATYLESLINTRSSFGRPVKVSLPPQKLPLPKLELQALANVFQQEMQRLPELATAQIEDQIDLEEGCKRVLAAAGRNISLQRLFSEANSRYEALVLFLALLELIKNEEIQATQLTHNSEIKLEHEKSRFITTT